MPSEVAVVQLAMEVGPTMLIKCQVVVDVTSEIIQNGNRPNGNGKKKQEQPSLPIVLHLPLGTIINTLADKAYDMASNNSKQFGKM